MAWVCEVNGVYIYGGSCNHLHILSNTVTTFPGTFIPGCPGVHYLELSCHVLSEGAVIILMDPGINALAEAFPVWFKVSHDSRYSISMLSSWSPSLGTYRGVSSIPGQPREVVTVLAV